MSNIASIFSAAIATIAMLVSVISVWQSSSINKNTQCNTALISSLQYYDKYSVNNSSVRDATLVGLWKVTYELCEDR